MAALAPAVGTPKLLSAAATGLAGFIESLSQKCDLVLNSFSTFVQESPSWIW